MITIRVTLSIHALRNSISCELSLSTIIKLYKILLRVNDWVGVRMYLMVTVVVSRLLGHVSPSFTTNAKNHEFNIRILVIKL